MMNRDNHLHGSCRAAFYAAENVAGYKPALRLTDCWLLVNLNHTKED
jgi:hypothetical protein